MCKAATSKCWLSTSQSRSSHRRRLAFHSPHLSRLFTFNADLLCTLLLQPHTYSMSTLAARFAVPLGLGVMALQASLYDVPGGYRAVMFDRFQGVKDIATNEGTHFLVALLQKAILYDVRIKPRNISTTTGSKDLQMVSLTLRVLSRPTFSIFPDLPVAWHRLRRACSSFHR